MSMNIISFLYPHLSHPSESRFQTLFTSYDNPAIPSPSSVSAPLYKSFMIKPENIVSNRDIRTTIMLKNISRELSKERIKERLSSVCGIDYIYVPKKKKYKNSGFVFVNVTSNLEILKIINALKEENIQNWVKGPKCVEICYSKVQGKEEMEKVFGNN